VDLQLETPLGGVALGEWAGGAARVLVKTAEGPRLMSDPWATERAA
ncbi:phosphoribosyl-dephospho-CoA transferase MdcG domain-containing protein, partial [Stutzerimonas kunmingensis]